MPRIDDYEQARQIAAASLSARSFETICRASGYSAESEDRFHVPFLDRIYRVDYPAFNFVDLADKDQTVPLQEQVLILHYLMAESPRTATGRWIAYREIPGAGFYYSAFVKRAIDPLKKVFGQNIGAFKKAAGRLGGKTADAGDAGFDFVLFPSIPVRTIIWEGDEEFPPEANILFDETVGEFLSPEDAAWLAGMLVYRLAALSKTKTP